VYEAIQYLIQKDQQQKEQGERNKIGYKSGRK
jgi:hypothetical protein